MDKYKELFNLENQVAIITGGSGLLGEQFCRTLTGAGAKVVVADINYASAQSVSKALDNGRAIPFEVDVSNQESISDMVEFALSNFRRIDILVNSAALDPKFDPGHSGQQSLGKFEDFPLADWNQALSVNLTGSFLCCQKVGAVMVDQNSGVIINISSIYGLVGPDQRIYQPEGGISKFKPVYYSVTKAGILGLTKYLAAYYAGKNIRVNALTPGGVFNDHNDDFIKAYSAKTILGRMANRDEMNGALLFLASKASSYMTGSNLIVDGGWTAW